MKKKCLTRERVLIVRGHRADGAAGSRTHDGYFLETRLEGGEEGVRGAGSGP